MRSREAVQKTACESIITNKHTQTNKQNPTTWRNRSELSRSATALMFGICLALRSVDRPKEPSNGTPHPIYPYLSNSCTIFFSSPSLLISAHLLSNFLTSFYPMPMPLISTDFHYSSPTMVLSTSPRFVLNFSSHPRSSHFTFGCPCYFIRFRCFSFSPGFLSCHILSI